MTWSDSQSESEISQTASGGGVKAGGPKFLLDHEYHEISDEEGAVESPRFEVSKMLSFHIHKNCSR